MPSLFHDCVHMKHEKYQLFSVPKQPSSKNPRPGPGGHKGGPHPLPHPPIHKGPIHKGGPQGTKATSPLEPVTPIEQQQQLPSHWNDLKYSVVRIRSLGRKFDWIEPYIPGPEMAGIGSGFFVQVDPEPLVVTNAHVVLDATDMALQLPVGT